MTDKSPNPEIFRRDEELQLCIECSFSPQRPPQMRDQNTHKPNGNVDEDSILPCCQACRGPIIPSMEGNDPKHYAPSFDSDVSQSTIKISEKSNLIMALTMSVRDADSCSGMPLTRANKEAHDRAYGFDFLGEWVSSLPIPGRTRTEIKRSIKKGRGSSLATLTDSVGSYVPVESVSVDNQIFAIGHWNDQGSRVGSSADDYVIVD